MLRTIQPGDIHVLVMLTCAQRKKKYPVLMADKNVVRMLVREMSHLIGRPATQRVVCDVMESVFVRAERNPIFTMHRAYMEEER